MEACRVQCISVTETHKFPLVSSSFLPGYLQCSIDTFQVVDIAGVINKMRHQRMKMVQTPVRPYLEVYNSDVHGKYRP